MKRLFTGLMLLLLAAGAWAQNYWYSAFLAQEGITLEGIELREQLEAIEDKDEQDKFFKDILQNKWRLYDSAVSLAFHKEKKNLSYLTKEQEAHVKNARKELVDTLPEGTLWYVFVKDYWSNKTLYIVYFLKLGNTESSWVEDKRFN